MDEFGRRVCCLVAGTTLGAMLAPAFVSESTSLLGYVATVAASAVVATGLYRSRWLRER
jgi:hypothetical protein